MTCVEDEKRDFLNNWAQIEGSVAEVSDTYPDCGCEDASAAVGGFGPVNNCETIRFFVQSRSDVDLKRRRKLSAAVFQRIFTEGKSVYRTGKAEKEELEYAASILYEIAIKNDQKFGGLIGVIDLNCSDVRSSLFNTARICCILETPLDPVGEKFKRPSHADIVYVSGNVEPDVRLQIRSKLYNDLIVNKDCFTDSNDLADMNLVQFLPECKKAEVASE